MNSRITICCLLVMLILCGCGLKEKPAGEREYFEVIKRGEKKLVVKLFDGNKYTIPFKPERTVVLYNSLLEPWKLSGGKSVGRVFAHDSLDDWADKIPVMGNMGSPNIELIMRQKPQLVIVADNIRGQGKIERFLRQNNIPTVPIDYASYYDFLEILRLFAVINDSEKEMEPVIAGLQKRVSQTVEKSKKYKDLKVLIIFASSKNISCELPNGDTGSLLKILGLKNIINESPIGRGRRVEFSLEKIIELDPDIIFVKTMGNIGKIESRIGKELIDNDAWRKLRAVKEDKVFFLPKEMFMYKANFKYPEAIEYLADKIESVYNAR